VKDEANKFAMPVSEPVSRSLFCNGWVGNGRIGKGWIGHRWVDRGWTGKGWAGIVATVTAGGLLFSVSGNVPPRQLSDGDGERSAERQVQVEAEPVAPARTVPADVSQGQIVALLDRAEKLAREQGQDFSPTVAQAAAELGMLYTTYQVQQRSAGEQNEGTDGVVEEHVRQEVLSAVPVSYVRAVDLGPDAEGEPDPVPNAVDEAVDQPGAVGHEIGHVTYDEVVIAAVRLATMLDQTAPGASVDVRRTDRSERSPLLAGPHGLGQRKGSSPRFGLHDVVAVHGGSTLGYANGRIPAAVLCALAFAPGHMLRCDAADQLTALSKKFEREFGYPIPITDSYRTYVEQVALAGSKPHLAAVPGTSNHGWGLAVDLSSPISGGASPEYAWLRVHGPDYGWDNPSWARPGGSKPEPWHFEFFAAGPVPDRAVDASDVDTWGSALASSSSEQDDPRSIPALDPRAKDDSPGTEVRQQPAKPKDEPSTSPPTKKPAKPAPKPKPKPSPSDPKPKPTPSKPAPKPTTPPPSSAPSPTPSPTPSEPVEEPPGSPAPSPSPSEPSQQPSAPPPSTPPAPSPPSPSPVPTPSDDSGTSPAATQAPSPSASADPPSDPGQVLELTADDKED
jgi:hypothetical protein